MNVTVMARRTLARIAIDRIQEDLVAIRTEYDEESLNELTSSVEGEGQLQPIVVAPAEGDNFELIIGSRRLRAARRRNEHEIETFIIEQQSPLNYILMALAENLHRTDLNPFEEANAFLRLMKDYGLSTNEVADKTRKGAHYVRSRIELISLPEEVQSLVASKALGLQFVQGLAKLPDGEAQTYFARKVVSDRLTQQEMRVLITRELGGPQSRPSRNKQSPEKVRIRLDMFASWLEKMPNKTIIKRMNSDERSAIAMSLQELEIKARTARHLFLNGKKPMVPSRPFSEGNAPALPRNHGEEWPSGDLARITAPDRPSDEVLGAQMGRAVSAIRGMRSKLLAGTKK